MKSCSNKHDLLPEPLQRVVISYVGELPQIKEETTQEKYREFFMEPGSCYFPVIHSLHVAKTIGSEIPFTLFPEFFTLTNEVQFLKSAAIAVTFMISTLLGTMALPFVAASDFSLFAMRKTKESIKDCIEPRSAFKALEQFSFFVDPNKLDRNIEDDDSEKTGYENNFELVRIF
jgi:hypothetical protein